MPGRDDVLQRLEALDSGRIRPGLERIQALLGALDDPHLAYPTAIVTGTNGKGSTAAMLASIGQSAGHRIGFYTSPHFTRLEERFHADGNPISRSGLVGQLDAVFSAVDRLMADRQLDAEPSYFEILTAAAFRYFAEARVDLAILEVGLGGRWDATNVTRPRVAVITPVAIDHTEFLGRNLAAIAAEKAGVVPPGGLAVIAPQADEAGEMIRRHLDRIGATPWQAKDHPLVVRTPDARLRTTIDCYGRLRSYVGLEISLPGRHQAQNARCAILAAEALDRRRLRIGSDAVWAGLRAVDWPGRCEWLGESPAVLLDAAHNPAAAEALAAYLRELRARRAFDKLHLIFGVMQDKDAGGIAAVLYPLADSLLATQPPSPRALPAEQLSEVGPAPDGNRSFVAPEKALEHALEDAGSNDLVCVTGSSYLVGALRQCLIEDAEDV